MGYPDLRACLEDLERTGQLLRIVEEVDPDLEAALILRRVYAAGGPALLFENLKGCRFPAVGNLFGTLKRARFLFRDTLTRVRRIADLKADPADLARHPWRYLDLSRAAVHALPRFVRQAPVLSRRCRISELPAIRGWPEDGGAFITLPQVYSEDPDRPGWRNSNLGMYRVQLDGGTYLPDQEVGLHYQIHRGLGIHHAAAIRRGQPLPVAISVGGPPALALGAIMPLPEGLSELLFAGVLGGRRLRLVRTPEGVLAPAEADFCLVGWIDPQQRKPEGPFGDHLGYYSRAHDFPVMTVQAVYHRPGAVWPFTSVGRPPQEDTVFGELIHELTAPAIPSVLPGVHAVHAVDAAGVHPLLLAIGSERYTPYEPRRTPRELLTQANAILGQGQLSLAKYLLIAAREDAPDLDLHDIPSFLRHMLERLDLRRDLHFQTRTTIDTLDYSGEALHHGSKVVLAAVGPPIRTLAENLPGDLRLPPGFEEPQVVLPGILAVRGPRWPGPEDPLLEEIDAGEGFPLVVVVEDSLFVARSLANFLWVAFTRSSPAPDLGGRGARVVHKHWGCQGPLILDARPKPHHAPVLEEDPRAVRRVEALAAPGGPLHGIF